MSLSIPTAVFGAAEGTRNRRLADIDTTTTTRDLGEPDQETIASAHEGLLRPDDHEGHERLQAHVTMTLAAIRNADFEKQWDTIVDLTEMAKQGKIYADIIGCEIGQLVDASERLKDLLKQMPRSFVSAYNSITTGARRERNRRVAKYKKLELGWPGETSQRYIARAAIGVLEELCKLLKDGVPLVLVKAHLNFHMLNKVDLWREGARSGKYPSHRKYDFVVHKSDLANYGQKRLSRERVLFLARCPLASDVPGLPMALGADNVLGRKASGSQDFTNIEEWLHASLKDVPNEQKQRHIAAWYWFNDLEDEPRKKRKKSKDEVEDSDEDAAPDETHDDDGGEDRPPGKRQKSKDEVEELDEDADPDETNDEDGGDKNGKATGDADEAGTPSQDGAHQDEVGMPGASSTPRPEASGERELGFNDDSPENLLGTGRGQDAGSNADDMKRTDEPTADALSPLASDSGQAGLNPVGGVDHVNIGAVLHSPSVHQLLDSAIAQATTDIHVLLAQLVPPRKQRNKAPLYTTVLRNSLEKTSWVTFWDADEQASSLDDTSAQDAQVHAYSPSTLQEASFRSSLGRPYLVVGAELDQYLADIFLDRLQEYPRDFHFDVIQPGTNHSALSKLTAKEFAEKLAAGENENLAQSFTTCGMIDIVEAHQPDFLRRRSTRLLPTIEKFSQGVSTTLLLDSSAFERPSRCTFTSRGSYTVENGPHLGARWIRCLSGSLIVFLIIDISEEERGEFYMKGRAWKPVSTPRRLVLSPGWELVLPNNDTVVFAQIALHDCVQAGGMFWKKKQFINILTSLRKLGERKWTGTGVIAVPRPAMIACLQQYCHQCVEDGTWRELSEIEHTLEEFNAAIRQADLIG